MRLGHGCRWGISTGFGRGCSAICGVSSHDMFLEGDRDRRFGTGFVERTNSAETHVLLQAPVNVPSE